MTAASKSGSFGASGKFNRRSGSVQAGARFEAADAFEDRDRLARAAERLAPGLAVQEAPLAEAEVDLPESGVGVAQLA